MCTQQPSLLGLGLLLGLLLAAVSVAATGTVDRARTSREVNARLEDDGFALVGFCDGPGSECERLASLLKASAAHASPALPLHLLVTSPDYFNRVLKTPAHTQVTWACWDGTAAQLHDLSPTHDVALALTGRCVPAFGRGARRHSNSSSPIDSTGREVQETPEHSRRRRRRHQHCSATRTSEPSVPWYADPRLSPTNKLDILLLAVSDAVQRHGAACLQGQLRQGMSAAAAQAADAATRSPPRATTGKAAPASLNGACNSTASATRLTLAAGFKFALSWLVSGALVLVLVVGVVATYTISALAPAALLAARDAATTAAAQPTQPPAAAAQRTQPPADEQAAGSRGAAGNGQSSRGEGGWSKAASKVAPAAASSGASKAAGSGESNSGKAITGTGGGGEASVEAAGEAGSAAAAAVAASNSSTAAAAAPMRVEVGVGEGPDARLVVFTAHPEERVECFKARVLGELGLSSADVEAWQVADVFAPNNAAAAAAAAAAAPASPAHDITAALEAPLPAVSRQLAQLSQDNSQLVDALAQLHAGVASSRAAGAVNAAALAAHTAATQEALDCLQQQITGLDSRLATLGKAMPPPAASAGAALTPTTPLAARVAPTAGSTGASAGGVRVPTSTAASGVAGMLGPMLPPRQDGSGSGGGGGGGGEHGTPAGSGAAIMADPTAALSSLAASMGVNEVDCLLASITAVSGNGPGGSGVAAATAGGGGGGENEQGTTAAEGGGGGASVAASLAVPQPAVAMADEVERMLASCPALSCAGSSRRASGDGLASSWEQVALSEQE